MPFIIHLTFLLLQILLFCPETDAKITWTTPPPQRGPLEISDGTVRETTQRLINGSSEGHLKWEFTLLNEILTRVSWQIDGVRIGTKEASGSITIQPTSNFREHFGISATDQATLIIYNVTEADNALFSCEVDTNTKSWVDRIRVEVVVPAEFTKNISTDQIAAEGSDLQLFCVAFGIPDPNVTWARVLNNGLEELHRGASLNIVNISSTYTGKYKCTASNGFGVEVSHELNVNVTFPPRNVTLPSEYEAAVKESISLYCRADGNPQPSFEWTPCNPQETPCNKNRLDISEVLDDGVYTCRVKNNLGSDSATTSFFIAAKQINVTLVITSERCVGGTYNQTSVLSTKLDEAIRKHFVNDSSYLGTSVKTVSCGSLIVNLALTFSSVVREKYVLSTLRNATKDGRLGEFSVNASSIVGTRPLIERSTTPPAMKPTTSAPGDKKMIWIIVGAILGAIAMLVIIGVVIWIVRKTKCRKDTKEVSDDKGAGQDKSGPSSGTGNNGYVDSGSAYAQPELSSRPPTKTAGKKEKKPGKKGKDPQPAALPLYAQVDKTKKKPREPENTYDDANDQRRRQPGEVTYTTLDHSDQGASLPRGAANQTSRPPPYTETTYAVLV